MTIRLLHIVCLSLLLGEPSRGAAQQSAREHQPSRVPVTVVMVDRLPASDGAFRVERRLTHPRDVILLRADANSDQLSDAVRSLLVIRQVSGDTATQASKMRMRPHQSSVHGDAARRSFPWVQRVLADLRRAAPQDVPGIGRARAIQIWLPPQHRRNR